MFDPVWTERPFIPIATERLLLRPFKDTDATPLTLLMDDIRVSQRLKRVPFPYSMEAAEKFIRFAQDSFYKLEGILLAITDRTMSSWGAVVLRRKN